MRQKKYILKQIAIICTAAFLFTGCGKADKSYDKGMEYIESEDYGKALKCFEARASFHRKFGEKMRIEFMLLFKAWCRRVTNIRRILLKKRRKANDNATQERQKKH